MDDTKQSDPSAEQLDEFSKVKERNINNAIAWYIHERKLERKRWGRYSGNSHQRRKQRRKNIRPKQQG